MTIDSKRARRVNHEAWMAVLETLGKYEQSAATLTTWLQRDYPEIADFTHASVTAYLRHMKADGLVKAEYHGNSPTEYKITAAGEAFLRSKAA